MLKVLKSGLLTTIQDVGRAGYQRFGVSCCGAMDNYALRIANLLVGNPETAAGLEVTLLGPQLQALEDSVISVAGADLTPAIEGRQVPSWESLLLKKDQVLSFGKRKRGARSYVCVAGGLKADHFLGSQSTDLKSKFGGMAGRSLEKEDVLLRTTANFLHETRTKRRVRPETLWEYRAPFTLRVVLGPQSRCFSENAISTLLTKEYLVTPESNRMGYRLQGPPLQRLPAEIISDPIPLGALQVLPNGQVVLLMADCQTVGGYPKIAVLISADMPKAAQLTIGHRVRFRTVSLEEAHRLLGEQQERISNAIGEEGEYETHSDL